MPQSSNTSGTSVSPAIAETEPTVATTVARKPKPVVRGGYVVLRRGETTSKLRGHAKPFEHGSFGAALTEAQRLAGLTKREFSVFEQVASACPFGLAADPTMTVEGARAETRLRAHQLITGVLRSDLGDAGADENADAILTALACAEISFAPIRLAAHLTDLVRLLREYVATFASDDPDEPALQREAGDLLANLNVVVEAR